MAPNKPNVVLIVSDTLRRDHLGAYGSGAIHTPHLDRFAEQSAIFDRHTTASFPTMPARADLLTGTFSFTYLGWEPLPPSTVTLPSLLSQQGYATIGITDTPFFVRSGFNYDLGFDDFIWIRGQGDETRPAERRDARQIWRSEADRMVARTMQAAEQWLERNHDSQPFFLYVDTWDPHEPWDAPDYLARLYKPDFVGPAPFPPYGRWQKLGLTPDELAAGHAAYCGEVTLVDRWVGWLIEKLDLLQLTDTTYVIFTSDHGFYFGEHEFFGKAEILGPLEAKVSADTEAPDWFVKVGYHTQAWSPLYGEVVCLPLIVRGPLVRQGRRTGLTTAPDIPATILHLAGSDEWRTTHGMSFRSALVENAKFGRELTISSWPLYFARGEWTTAIDSKPREITSYMPLTIRTDTCSVIYTGRDYPSEFYDLAIDQGETHNVWEENFDRGADLVRRGLGMLAELGTAEEHLTPRVEALAEEERARERKR